MHITIKLLISILIPLSVSAPIYELATITDIHHHITPHTKDSKTRILVIFDIDNTLLTADHPHQLASDQWFESYSRYLHQQGYSAHEAFEHALASFISLQDHVPSKPVQAHETVRLVRALHAQGITVLFLTVRSHCLRSITEHALTHHGLMQHPHALIMTEGAPKGPALCDYLHTAYLPTHGALPTLVIMVDDKQRHVESVHHTCDTLGIPCIGLRYGYLDATVASFTFCPELHVPTQPGA